nr:MAG TPA: Thaumarchaeal output domain 1 [Caudoviricetes sp.]
MRLKKCIVCGKLFQARQGQAKCEDCIAAVRATTIRPRVCRQCGTTFDGGPRAWYCPTCRAERQRIRNAAQRKTGARRPLGSIDHCVVCGKEYVVEGGLQKYCKDCAPEAIRAVDREQSKKWAKENGYYEARRAQGQNGIKICVICGGIIPPGSCSVTCSPECHRQRLRLSWAEADKKRGINTTIPEKIKRLDKERKQHDR